jgi:hypothetical protein
MAYRRPDTDKARLNFEKSIWEQREAETVKNAFNAEIENGISVLIPFIDEYAAELRKREGQTDPETITLLTTYCQLETLYLQLIKERKNTKTRQTTRRR